MSSCHNNPEKLSTTKINKHTPSGYSFFTYYCLFDTTENKLDPYRGKNCMKNFCLDLKEHVTKIINYEKQEMITLRKKEKKMYNKQKVCYISKNKKDLVPMITIKKYHKVRDHCHYTGRYRGAVHDICNVR